MYKEFDAPQKNAKHTKKIVTKQRVPATREKMFSAAMTLVDNAGSYW